MTWLDLKFEEHRQTGKENWLQGTSDEKIPVLLYFLFTRWLLPGQFYLRNANVTSHQEEKKTNKKCHIPIKRSWHEQTATMTINNNKNNDVGEQNKNIEYLELPIKHESRQKCSWHNLNKLRLLVVVFFRLSNPMLCPLLCEFDCPSQLALSMCVYCTNTYRWLMRLKETANRQYSLSYFVSTLTFIIMFLVGFLPNLHPKTKLRVLLPGIIVIMQSQYIVICT